MLNITLFYITICHGLGSAEVLLRFCGGSAEVLRRFCGGSAEVLRRFCGEVLRRGSAEAVLKANLGSAERFCGRFCGGSVDSGKLLDRQILI